VTCIVGYRHGGKVWIGGDSAGVSGYDLTPRADPKVFVRDGIAMGFTTSFRMGQLLAHRLKVPPLPEKRADLMRWMVHDFVDAVRACLKEGGFATKSSEVETGGTFLVGVRGRLFAIESDYQVGEALAPYESVGCGRAYAIGACAVLADREPSRPEALVREALRVAAANSAGVRAPFRVVSA
jgi:ATP-dependent protease HslVU (ClpYQ) peptidase subunit